MHPRTRYGGDAEIGDWRFDGDRTYTVIVIGYVPDLGGRLEVYGEANFTE